MSKVPEKEGVPAPKTSDEIKAREVDPRTIAADPNAEKWLRDLMGWAAAGNTTVVHIEPEQGKEKKE